MLDKVAITNVIDVKKLFAQIDIQHLYRLGAVCLLAYLLAGIGSLVALGIFLDHALLTKPVKMALGPTDHKIQSDLNFHHLKQDILDRNLFNSQGKVPTDEGLDAGESGVKKFDINAPCSAVTAKIELLGTIYTGNQATSLATVKENGIEDADVYRVGDEIIDSGGIKVAMIEPKKLILNNSGKKECLELKNVELNQSPSYALDEASASKFNGDIPEQNTPSPPTAAGGGSSVVLEAAFVEAELGQGFAKIIQSARVVPNMNESNVMNGFKVFSIKPGSLMSRLFHEGDVITQVNDSNLSQPDQGFSLYQALQGDQEIRINVLRGGATKETINVQIK